LEPDHIHLYNEALESFTHMISNHIISIQQFRGVAEAALEIRRPPSHDGNGVKEMQPEEKMERIARGRARDWRRKRFDPRRYQNLADVALSEL